MKKFPKLDEKDLPTVSILVAARNEENNILSCITGLDKLEYPEDKIEIFIIDDHSTDRTNEIVSQFIQDKPKFRIFQPEKKLGELKGKANALANAIKQVKNEVILTTDADCVVNPLWAKTLASYFEKDVAMVCGYTDQHKRTVFEGMQAADFIYLLGVAAGMMNLGQPLSCIGNNMAYRKSVYDEVGGYENIKFSVTEDFQLLHAMNGLKKYKIIYPLDAGGYVLSEPCPNMKVLYWQKKRWGVGGLNSKFIGFFTMSFGFFMSASIFVLPFFISLHVLLILFGKILMDYLFLKVIYKGIKSKIGLFDFIMFQIYLPIYVVVLPILVTFSRNVVWKERKF
ncbi:MAG: glycosyl transferase [Melioribacteraceae bacterium]|nr:MAG: glycosyl transferase [Melioribacteraceae bacterium]